MDVPSLREMPTLLEEAGWIWRAFETLSAQRKFTDQGRPQPIEMGEVLAYAVYNGIDDEDRREDLLQALERMDALWRDEVTKKMTADAKRRPRPPAPKRPSR